MMTVTKKMKKAPEDEHKMKNKRKNIIKITCRNAFKHYISNLQLENFTILL